MSEDKYYETKKRWREENREKDRECKAKWRENNREKDREIKREWSKNNLDKERKYQKDYNKKYPNKIKAQRLAQDIKIDRCCERCGSDDRLEKHHSDYNEPLKVEILCKSCHTQTHILIDNKEVMI